MAPKGKAIAVVYHADCLDGFGAAWAAWKKFGSRAEYHGVHHNDAPLRLTGKTVYFLDIMYSGKALADIRKHNKVIGIDHHISAKKAVESLEEFRYAANHSGATLAWKYFHPGVKTPRMLLHIEDIDIWKNELKHTPEAISYLELLPFDFGVWSKFIADAEKPAKRREFIRDGALLRKYFDNLSDRIIEDSAVLVNFLGYKVYAVNAPHVFSTDIGHKLYEKRPPFSIIWRMRGNGIRVSLRGNGTVDLTKVAAKFGGGGHKGAAGFTVPFKKVFPWKKI